MNLIDREEMVDRRRHLRDQVYDMLRERIITGRIAPGDTIDDKDIAAELGISRTPVREAIKKLSDERLVDVIAQSGTRAAVAQPSATPAVAPMARIATTRRSNEWR